MRAVSARTAESPVQLSSKCPCMGVSMGPKPPRFPRKHQHPSPKGTSHGRQHPDPSLAEWVLRPAPHFSAGFPWEKGKHLSGKTQGSCCGWRGRYGDRAGKGGTSDFLIQEGPGCRSEPGPSLSLLQPAEPQREPAELCVSAIMSHKIK